MQRRLLSKPTARGHAGGASRAAKPAVFWTPWTASLQSVDDEDCSSASARALTLAARCRRSAAPCAVCAGAARAVEPWAFKQPPCERIEGHHRGGGGARRRMAGRHRGQRAADGGDGNYAEEIKIDVNPILRETVAATPHGAVRHAHFLTTAAHSRAAATSLGRLGEGEHADGGARGVPRAPRGASRISARRRRRGVDAAASRTRVLTALQDGANPNICIS